MQTESSMLIEDMQFDVLYNGLNLSQDLPNLMWTNKSMQHHLSQDLN